VQNNINILIEFAIYEVKSNYKKVSIFKNYLEELRRKVKIEKIG